MSLLATITRVPAITLSEWSLFVASSVNLKARVLREMVSPFKGEMRLAPVREGSVDVVVEGERMGAIVPGDDFGGYGELEVFGAMPIPEKFRRAVEVIARELQVTLVWIP